MNGNVWRRSSSNPMKWKVMCESSNEMVMSMKKEIMKWVNV